MDWHCKQRLCQTIVNIVSLWSVYKWSLASWNRYTNKSEETPSRTVVSDSLNSIYCICRTSKRGRHRTLCGFRVSQGTERPSNRRLRWWISNRDFQLNLNEVFQTKYVIGPYIACTKSSSQWKFSTRGSLLVQKGQDSWPGSAFIKDFIFEKKRIWNQRISLLRIAPAAHELTVRSTSCDLSVRVSQEIPRAYVISLMIQLDLDWKPFSRLHKSFEEQNARSDSSFE